MHKHKLQEVKMMAHRIILMRTVLRKNLEELNTPWQWVSCLIASFLSLLFFASKDACEVRKNFEELNTPWQWVSGGIFLFCLLLSLLTNELVDAATKDGESCARMITNV